MAVTEITADELADRIDAGEPVFDVRRPDEYESGHVPGAVLIPLDTVPDQVDEFPADREFLVICRSGARSMRAAEYLEQFGRTGVNVAGGTLAWIDTGRDVVEGDEPGVTHLRIDSDRRSQRWWSGSATSIATRSTPSSTASAPTSHARARAAGLGSRCCHRRRRRHRPRRPAHLRRTPRSRRCSRARVWPCCTPPSRTSTCSTTPCGAIPAHLFDTQLAAGFLGYSTPSLVSLLCRRAEGAGRRRATGSPTGCAARSPTTSAPTRPATSPTCWRCRTARSAKLEAAGRLAVGARRVRGAAHPPGRPARPGGRLAAPEGRPHPQASGPRCGPGRRRLARAPGDGERHPAPPRAARPGAARHLPEGARTAERDLLHARGVDERHARGRLGGELLAAVARGRRPAGRSAGTEGDELERHLRPAVTLVSAWVSEVGRREQIDTTLLGHPGRPGRPPARRRVGPVGARLAQRSARRRHPQARRRALGAGLRRPGRLRLIEVPGA